MTIGEQIINDINNGSLLYIKTVSEAGTRFSYNPNAAKELDTIIEAHVQKRIRESLELAGVPLTPPPNSP